MSTQIQLKKDTAANWTSNNPTLASGELGYETDTGAAKMGDGATAWTSLTYYIGKSQSWTPSWTNVTVGSSTNVGEYFRIGKLIHFTASITSGASFAITGNVQVSLPVTAAVTPPPSQLSVWFLDSGLNYYPGSVTDASGTTTLTHTLCALNAAGTYTTLANISSTIPFTWNTSSDKILVSGWYVAA